MWAVGGGGWCWVVVGCGGWCWVVLGGVGLWWVVVGCGRQPLLHALQHWIPHFGWHCIHSLLSPPPWFYAPDTLPFKLELLALSPCQGLPWCPLSPCLKFIPKLAWVPRVPHKSPAVAPLCVLQLGLAQILPPLSARPPRPDYYASLPHRHSLKLPFHSVSRMARHGFHLYLFSTTMRIHVSPPTLQELLALRPVRDARTTACKVSPVPYLPPSYTSDTSLPCLVALPLPANRSVATVSHRLR